MIETKIELTRPGKNKDYRLEPRILIHKPDLSYGDPKSENMLIHGDNLLALKALEQEYAGRIKCIYIDPPYNTGNAFEHYDDGLEHSEWLSLMKPRLELLRNTLKEDGVIFVQIDEEEMAYLKVLMDEVFGRSNYINSIVVKMSPEGGLKTTHKTKTIIKIKEYVLAYCKNKEFIRLIPQYIENKEYNTEYERIVLNYEDNPNNWKIERLYKVLNEKGFNIKSNLSNLDLKDPALKDFIIDNAYRIRYRTRLPQGKAEELKDNFNTVVEYAPGQYGYKGRRMSFLDKTLQEILIYGVYKKTFGKLLGDIYTDIIIQKIFNEGGVVFNNGKKPEDLIYRLISMVSDNKNDIVLDSFLGSGTTCAVAQKMGRSWIGIEYGEHAYTHCKSRIDNVINNEDKGGISKLINWKGGGGYKFYELGPSVLIQDNYGNYII